jgi:hypothetical protein
MTTQRDNMLDLQGVVVDDDALDNQPQDSLALAKISGLQSATDTLAERGQVGECFVCLEPLLVKAALPVILLLRQLALLEECSSLAGQLIEGDHLGLVGIKKPTVGSFQPLETGAQMVSGAIRGIACSGEKALELCPQLGRVAKQVNNVIPDRLLEGVCPDTRPRTFRITCGVEWIRSGASVVAPPGPTAVSRKDATMNAKAAVATLQQAAQ